MIQCRESTCGSKSGPAIEPVLVRPSSIKTCASGHYESLSPLVQKRANLLLPLCALGAIWHRAPPILTKRFIHSQKSLLVGPIFQSRSCLIVSCQNDLSTKLCFSMPRSTVKSLNPVQPFQCRGTGLPDRVSRVLMGRNRPFFNRRESGLAWKLPVSRRRF